VLETETQLVHVRPAMETDAEPIVHAHFAAVHQTASDFYPRDVLDSWSRQPDETRYQQIRQAIVQGDELFLVAEDASGVVGFGSIVPASHELRALYVHPRVARRGVGTKLLGRLGRLAVLKHCAYLQLEASLNAEAFYSRHGYEVVERGVHRLSTGHEMACVKMKKTLQQESR
jgi:putative acetyltransferase